MTDPMMYIEQHLAAAGVQTSQVDSDLQSQPGEDKALVAQDAAFVCGRCDRRIRAGQPMRLRASGGWAHESC
jgi:hypothetical protein